MTGCNLCRQLDEHNGLQRSQVSLCSFLFPYHLETYLAAPFILSRSCLYVFSQYAQLLHFRLRSLLALAMPCLCLLADVPLMGIEFVESYHAHCSAVAPAYPPLQWSRLYHS